MRLNIIVQDNVAKPLEELVVQVADDMTKRGLLDALRENKVIPESAKYEILFALNDETPFSGIHFSDGATIYVREQKAGMQIIERKDAGFSS